MNSNPQDPLASESSSGSISDSVEDTLQLIARLPAPAGLEDRVYAALSPRHAVSDGRLAEPALLGWKVWAGFWPGPGLSAFRVTGCAPRPPRPSSLWLPVADGGFIPRPERQTASPPKLSSCRVACSRAVSPAPGHAHATDPPRPHSNTARQAKACAAQGTRKPVARRPLQMPKARRLPCLLTASQ